jgi:hypothetical protein
VENCRGIELILQVVLSWATAQPTIRGVALVGSHELVRARSILCAREETRESRGMLELFLNTGRGFWVARRRKSAIFEGFRGTLRVKDA